MKNRYKLPSHLRNYIKNELYNYKSNKEKLKQIQNNNTSTRTILIVTKRLQNIEKVIDSLEKEEEELAKKIFFEGYNSTYMELNHFITKDVYYNIMNKVIFLVATEYELV